MTKENNTSAPTNKFFANATGSGEIPSYNGSERAKASDYANYFCSYAQLYHQKQMLADHNRMAAYHSAIMGNSDVFKDKVVMDIGTGSGILAVWAAQAGAKKVYAVEYTDMAKHAQTVMETNGVADTVQVIQGAVEDLELESTSDGVNSKSDEDIDMKEALASVSATTKTTKIEAVDIIISEWMGYFLLRESMLDTIIRARDKFLKKETGLVFPSHTTMFLAPIQDEEERKKLSQEYSGAMSDWNEFTESTRLTYGVDMNCLERNYEKEQKDYYLLSSRWSELAPENVLAEPSIVKYLDMMTCTIEDSKGIFPGDPYTSFDFEIISSSINNDNATTTMTSGPVSGFAGWFSADFKSRTDENSDAAPKVSHPATLSTGPEAGYTHWGQQTFYLLSSIPLINGETTRVQGSLDMVRSQDNARLYNCRIRYNTSRRKSTEPEDGFYLMKGGDVEHVYEIP